jgi:hypothetical protein
MKNLQTHIFGLEDILESIEQLINEDNIIRFRNIINGLKEIASEVRVQPEVMPNEVLAGGQEELIERVAKYLIAIMFNGANLGIGNSSLRNLTEEEYFNLNKDEWKIRAFALVDRIKASRREA